MFCQLGKDTYDKYLASDIAFSSRKIKDMVKTAFFTSKMKDSFEFWVV